MIQTSSAPSQAIYDQIVTDILSQPGYWHLKNAWADFIATATASIEKWLLETLGKLFETPQTSTPFSSGFSTAVVILCAVGLIALVLLVAGLFTGVFRRSSRLHGILGETITAETTPDTLMERARAAEQSGDTRQAVRLGFIAVLLKMHRARMVFLDETWTNQELYAHLERNQFTSLPSIKGVMEGFNAAWYGHKNLGNEAYRQWQLDLEKVWQEVTSREI